MIPVRVVHIPARTPYARKLRDEILHILNGEPAANEIAVPRDATLSWLLGHRPWDWFDVLHLHHLDLEPVATLRQVLSECRRDGKRVVYTAHDVSPIFADRLTHHRRLELLAAHEVPFICLTPASEGGIRERLGAATAFIPHGYVAAPGIAGRRVSLGARPTRFLMFGSLRRNRDVEMVLHCWRFARDLRDSQVQLLLRAPSRASWPDESNSWRAIREHSVDPRLEVSVLPFPSDEDVIDAVVAADCLVLPYRWASHSGQLELALDLGVLPVAARVGFLPDQVALHGATADQPVWFDWSDDSPYEYGPRLLTALQEAHQLIRQGWQAGNRKAFADHRRQEHVAGMAAYRALCLDRR